MYMWCVVIVVLFFFVFFFIILIYIFLFIYNIVGGCSHMIMIVQELFALSRVRRRPTNLFQVSAEKGDHAPGRS